jgi:hypothetical protein
MIRHFNRVELRIPGVGSTSTATTSTSDFILSSKQIAADTFKIGDNIKVRAIYSKGIVNSTPYTIRLHWNQELHLTGATQLAQYDVIGSGDTSPSLYRNITFKSSNQVKVFSTGSSFTSDVVIGAYTATTLSNIDISSNGFIMASAQRTNISRINDTISCLYLSVEV